MKLTDLKREAKRIPFDEVLALDIQGWLSPTERRMLYTLAYNAPGPILRLV
jgi:hypothetical protein